MALKLYENYVESDRYCEVGDYLVQNLTNDYIKRLRELLDKANKKNQELDLNSKAPDSKNDQNMLPNLLKKRELFDLDDDVVM